MKTTYIVSDNIITSLGFSTADNLTAIESMTSGLKLVTDSGMFTIPFFGSLVDKKELKSRSENLSLEKKYTLFEQLCILSVSEALKNISFDYQGDDTLLILSTTKGNINLLDASGPALFPKQRLFLWKAADVISGYFNLKNRPVVISNACISGVIGLMTGARLIEKGMYKNIIVVGADILTGFVVSGFQSFKSLGTTPCKPFDKDRDGLSLGEGAGTVMLTSEPGKNIKDTIVIIGGSGSNDANHISGPSRTGEGLYVSIKRAMTQAKERADFQLGFISCHGTATPFNDEMEAIAFDRTGVNNVPVVGLKGFWGHTLGAAGVIESIAAYQSLLRGVIHATAGYDNPGVSKPVIVYKEPVQSNSSACLKVASGFGGCNAAMVFSKR